jgi:plasmid segregation protein ParM
MLQSGVIAIDDGGNTTGIVTKNGLEMFPSVKGLHGNRTITNITGKYDFIVDYKGEKYVMGDLAKWDCEYPMQMHSKTKCHEFFDLSVLVAIHQFGYSQNYLITSVPISMHNEDEKQNRIERLKGEHTITVNGKTKTFYIEDVKVAPETAVAFWLKEPQGKTRYIDLGSRTIGYATTVCDNGATRFIDTESGTFMGMGIEALGEKYNQKGLADYICGRLNRQWSENDDVFLLGGGALDEELVTHIRRYFPKSSVLENPQMANAKGMYVLGRVAYNLA